MIPVSAYGIGLNEGRMTQIGLGLQLRQFLRIRDGSLKILAKRTHSEIPRKKASRMLMMIDPCP